MIPLVLRETVSIVQTTNANLSYGPYPKRKDGGTGWFYEPISKKANLW